MALVTSDEVKAIVATSMDVSTFIATADLIVSEDLADKGLSADRLKQIELYLAAHFLAITQEKGGLKSQKIGEAAESYQIRTDMKGFGLTRFGQQAMDLDTSGTLRTMATTVGTAKFRVV